MSIEIDMYETQVLFLIIGQRIQVRNWASSKRTLELKDEVLRIKEEGTSRLK